MIVVAYFNSQKRATLSVCRGKFQSALWEETLHVFYDREDIDEFVRKMKAISWHAGRRHSEHVHLECDGVGSKNFGMIITDAVPNLRNNVFKKCGGICEKIVQKTGLKIEIFKNIE